jgi:hypothetical protein
VGNEGTIVATRDGGEHWQPVSCGTMMSLGGVHFTDSRSGWAVGNEGTIFATRDNGEHWQPVSSGTDENLRCVHFADARTGWAVGSEGLLLHAGPPTYAPWIDEHEAMVKSDLDGSVELSFLVHTESMERVLHANVDYKTKGKSWDSLEQILGNPDSDRRWRIKWNSSISDSRQTKISNIEFTSMMADRH